jgi:oligosaccharide repeat unit polymerase
MLSVLIVFLAALVIANYHFKRSVLYPPFLFCAMWLFDACLYRAGLIQVDPLHLATLCLIAAGALVYSFGGVLAFLVSRRLIATRISLIGQPKIAGKWLRNLIVFSLAISVVIAIRQLMSLAAATGGVGGAFFAVARNAIVENINEGTGANHLYTYVWGWTILAAALFYSEADQRFSWLTAALAFVSCVLSGARGGFLFLFSALTCIFLIRSKRERFIEAMQFARWPMLAFFFLFVGLFFVDKTVQSGASTAISFAGQHLVEYIVGPTAALDLVLQHPSDYTGLPNHTFRFFLRAVSAVGLLSYQPPAALDRFVFVPFGTNVYTVYKFFVTDFGAPVALACIGVVGFLHSLLFRKAHTQSVLGLYLFSITVFSVLMVIFDDVYSQFGLYFEALMSAAIYLTVKSIPWNIFRSASPGQIARW